jgi:hypothetical protein
MAPSPHVAIELLRGGGVRLNPRKMKLAQVVIFATSARTGSSPSSARTA